MPALPGPASSHDISSFFPWPPRCFDSSRWEGLAVRSDSRTCFALAPNLAEETRTDASLWFKIYCNSGTGNAGDRGTAIDRAAMIANNVTDQPNGTAAHGISENDTLGFSYGYESISGSQSLLTYVIIAVLY